MTVRGGAAVPDAFGPLEREYAAARNGTALHDRSYRGLIEVCGADRAAWLNNLVTNVIKTVSPGEGNYAFVLNSRGRILFDVNMLVTADAIRLDVERSHVALAMRHFGKYIITEDVRLHDRSDEFLRLALLGPKVPDVMAVLGAPHAAAMAQLQHGLVELEGRPRFFVRHDFAGVFGVEFVVEASDAPACWKRLMVLGPQPVGLAAVQTLRIEAGIPWCGEDLHEEVLPAETGQAERAVNYRKGCYLGQEVVERMRSRGGLARTLVGLRLEGETAPELPATLRAGASDVGRLTSVCRSPAAGGLIGLGYVKVAAASAGTRVEVAEGSGVFSARVAALPFR